MTPIEFFQTEYNKLQFLYTLGLDKLTFDIELKKLNRKLRNERLQCYHKFTIYYGNEMCEYCGLYAADEEWFNNNFKIG